MSKLISIVAGCGVALGALSISYIRHLVPRTPPTEESKYLTLQNEQTLQQRWDDGQFSEEPPLLAKGPRIVQTIKVSPDPVETTEVKKLESPEPPGVKRKKNETNHSDVCSRHRMRKVYTRNGKSWRCRK